MDEDEDNEVSGYIFTHFDCPHCNEPGEVEGDAAGDTITCTACDGELKIGTVR
jgi:transcription elongation factor Elf1